MTEWSFSSPSNSGLSMPPTARHPTLYQSGMAAVGPVKDPGIGDGVGGGGKVELSASWVCCLSTSWMFMVGTIPEFPVSMETSASR